MNWAVFGSEMETKFGPVVDPTINFWLPSGLTLLDTMMRGKRAFLDGGYPGGTFTELSGEAQSGKTAAACRACATVQARGGLAVWMDMEGRFDADLAQTNGLQLDNGFLPYRPESFDKCLGGMETLFEKFLSEETKLQKLHKKSPKKLGDFKSVPLIVVIDSIADAGNAKTNERNQGDKDYKALPMSNAALFADFSRKRICRDLAGRNVFVLLLNQVRTDVQMFGAYGPPDLRTPGGHAVKHKMSTRLRFSQTALDKADKVGQRPGAPLGALTQIKGLKLAGPPGRIVLAPYYYHFGFCDALSCLNYLIGLEYLKREKDGTTWKVSVNGELRTKLGWRRLFYKDPAFANEIRQFARDAYTEQCTYVENTDEPESPQTENEEEGE